MLSPSALIQLLRDVPIHELKTSRPSCALWRLTHGVRVFPVRLSFGRLAGPVDAREIGLGGIHGACPVDVVPMWPVRFKILQRRVPDADPDCSKVSPSVSERNTSPWHRPGVGK
eukprot:5759489-Amphidinium_carterae.2